LTIFPNINLLTKRCIQTQKVLWTRLKSGQISDEIPALNLNPPIVTGIMRP